MPKIPVDFAGPSYFGGKNDQLVLCAGKGKFSLLLQYLDADFYEGGDIFIWDRESAAPLHHIRPQALGSGDLTCIAWNHAAEHFMFATGSHDGAVRVWTSQAFDNKSSDEIQSRGPSLYLVPTPRTASPVPSLSAYDLKYRTESPAANTDSQGGTPATGSQADLLSPEVDRNRSVTFHEHS